MANVSSSNGLEKYPKLRFKGFSEAWEQVKLLELTEIAKGQQLGKLEMISGATYYVMNGGISPSGYTNKYNADANTISISEGGNSCGFVNMNTEKFWSGGHNYTLNSPSVDSYFLFSLLKYKEKEIMALRVGSGLPNIQKSALENFAVHITRNANEQIKIGSFLRKLDDFISLQRQKVELLKKYKRGVSEQLFEQIKSKSTQHVFSSIFVLVQNNTFSRELLTNEETTMQNIHYGDVLIKYGSCVDIDKDAVPYIKSDAPVDKFATESYLMTGDIVIADTAEDYTVGKATEIINPNNKKILSGLHTIPCRPVMNFAPMFMGYYLNSSSFRSQIMPLIQGTKVSSIGKSQLMKTTVYIPPVDDQKRIADFLYSIDTKINLLSETADKMIQLKSAMLQQLFI